MSAVDEQIRQRRRGERQVALWAVAGVLLVAAAMDWLTTGGFVPAAVVARVLFALLLVGAAVRMGRASEAEESRLALGVAVASPLFVGLIALASGGMGPPVFLWLMAIGPMAAAVMHHEVRAVAGAALSSVGVGMALLAWDGQPLKAVLRLGVMVASAGCIGVLGSRSFRRMRDAELESNRRHLAAVQQLADSERRRAEAERLAVLGQLAAGVAHEVNNPLAYAMTNVHLLQEELAQPTLPPAEVRQLVDETLVGLERIRQIVRDLQNFARRPVRDELPLGCEVPVVLDEALRLASVRLRPVAQVERHLAERLPPVHFSDRHLAQVLVNLLSNTADALDGREGGRVRVVAQPEGGEWVRLSVEDNGPGIAPAVLDRLFEPFVTTKGPGRGTGLGLALSREYVERFGGTLEGYNLADGGAAFVLRLRTAQCTAAVPAGAPPSPPAR